MGARVVEQGAHPSCPAARSSGPDRGAPPGRTVTACGEEEFGLRRPFYSLYQRRLRHNLGSAPLPKHIAMILDGNRRWAKLAGLESAEHGHRAGADKLIEFAGWVDGLQIPHVTFYLLSTDNLQGRTGDELTALFDIIGTLALDLSTRWRVQHVGHDGGAARAAAVRAADRGGAGEGPLGAAHQPRDRLRRPHRDRRTRCAAS